MTKAWEAIYAHRRCSLEDALKAVARGAKVFLGTACAEPQYLVQGLIDRANTLRDVQLLHFITLGDAPYTEKRFDEKFRHNIFFLGPGTRRAVNEGRADYTPAFISEIPKLFRKRIVPIDVALIQTSPPDAHGFLSLGISVDIIKAALESARVVIAQVNHHMPRTLGDTFIPVQKIDYFVEHDDPLEEFEYPVLNEVGTTIACHMAKLINDGDTLHIGFGYIPHGVLKYLGGKKDLGIHTEVITDAFIDLIEEGKITGERKTLHPGRVVCSFCVGTRQIYEYVADNPQILFYPAEYVYDPLVIARNDNMVSIGTALEVDLSGQICSESMGHYVQSGVGGRLDFIRGAAMSRDGKAIIGLPSTRKNETESNIRPHLLAGAGVVATRGDVQYVVTEYGTAYLQGKTLRERAMALINIAHPKFRQELLEEAKKHAYVYPDQILIDAKTHAYPQREEHRVTLKDGTQVLIRPIKPTDEPLLQDFFYSQSEETIYRRYFRAVKAMPHAKAQTLVNLDYHNRMAFVATLGPIGLERIIGLGRYAKEEDHEGMVEAAYIIDEDYQAQGLGTLLQRHLEDYIRKKGFRGVSAYLFKDNVPMMKIFAKAGPYSEELAEENILRIWRILDRRS
ncbi:MAG: GNAT family N-acetyltransferase [Desulfatiglandales bacterium]